MSDILEGIEGAECQVDEITMHGKKTSTTC